MIGEAIQVLQTPCLLGSLLRAHIPAHAPLLIQKRRPRCPCLRQNCPCPASLGGRPSAGVAAHGTTAPQFRAFREGLRDGEEKHTLTRKQQARPPRRVAPTPCTALLAQRHAVPKSSYPRMARRLRHLAGVGQAVVLGRSRAVHQHGGHLHLARGVERAHADVRVGERLGGGVDLLQHLQGTAASKGSGGSGPVPAPGVLCCRGSPSAVTTAIISPARSFTALLLLLLRPLPRQPGSAGCAGSA